MDPQLLRPTMEQPLERYDTICTGTFAHHSPPLKTTQPLCQRRCCCSSRRLCLRSECGIRPTTNAKTLALGSRRSRPSPATAATGTGTGTMHNGCAMRIGSWCWCSCWWRARCLCRDPAHTKKNETHNGIKCKIAFWASRYDLRESEPAAGSRAVRRGAATYYI
jgi:hypothetical protein